MGQKKAAEEYQQVYLRITSRSPVRRSAVELIHLPLGGLCWDFGQLHARIRSQLERGEVDSKSSVLLLLLNTHPLISLFFSVTDRQGRWGKHKREEI